MASFVAINKELHLHAAWHRPAGLTFAAEDMTVPVLLEEIPHLIGAIPLVFVKTQEHFTLCALLSLQPGRNLYVSPGGQWLAGYIPALYRAYPFKALKAEGSGALTLCFDMDSGLFCEQPQAGAQAMFDDEGEPVKLLQDTIAFLKKCEAGRQFTQRAVDQLAEHDLIGPMNVQVQVPGRDAPELMEGLYTIKESDLRKKDGSVLQDLNQSQALALAFGQIFSQHKIKSLGKLMELHKSAAAKEPLPEDLSGILGQQNDTLSFE